MWCAFVTGQSGFQNKHLKLLSVLLSAVGPALKGQINTLEKICFSSLLSESASSAQRLGFSQILALLPQASGETHALLCTYVDSNAFVSFQSTLLERSHFLDVLSLAYYSFECSRFS